jgi:hypothetical protein
VNLNLKTKLTTQKDITFRGVAEGRHHPGAAKRNRDITVYTEQPLINTIKKARNKLLRASLFNIGSYYRSF